MSATEILRRLLDERGVEYETYIEQPTGFEHVKWNFNEHGSADFNLEFGEPWLTMYGVISGPEQAIAATLGDSDTTGERRCDVVEVVRCRDCKYYTPESMTREERMFGVYENVWEPGGCFNPSRCSSTWDHIKEQMVPVGIDTDPDGFCAWGKRRADHD